MKKYIVTLAEDERVTLGALITKGKHKSQKILNALILLGCDEGEFQTKRSTNEEMAKENQAGLGVFSGRDCPSI